MIVTPRPLKPSAARASSSGSPVTVRKASRALAVSPARRRASPSASSSSPRPQAPSAQREQQLSSRRRFAHGFQRALTQRGRVLVRECAHRLARGGERGAGGRPPAARRPRPRAGGGGGG